MASENSAGGAWKTREYWLLVGLLVITGVTVAAFPNYIVALMQEDLHASERVSGYGWSLMGAMGIFSGLLGGALADRHSSKLVMLGTYVVMSIGLVLVAFIHWVPAAIVSCVLNGIAYNAVYVLHPVYIARIYPPEQTAGIFGVMNLCSGLGVLVSNYVGGYLQTLTGSFTLTYQLMLYVSLPAIVICLVLRSDKKRPALTEHLQ